MPEIIPAEEALIPPEEFTFEIPPTIFPSKKKRNT